MKPERILVCGGRNYTERNVVFETLSTCRPHFADQFCIIQGHAHGADKLARDWALENGYCCIDVPAPWNYYKLAAGPIRNAWMLYFCCPQLVIAFPGGSGTADMVARANGAGVPVYAI